MNFIKLKLNQHYYLLLVKIDFFELIQEKDVIIKEQEVTFKCLLLQQQIQKTKY